MSSVLISDKILVPKNLNTSSIPAFLNSCEKIFQFKNKRKSGYALDLERVKKTSLLGVLIIYKVVEYSVINECFDRPLLLLNVNSDFGVHLEKYGFTNLILGYIENKKEVRKLYDKLEVNIGSDFIIAPQALIRSDKKSREEINNKYLPKIEKYYRSNPKVVSMILLVFSEILLNFWEHAVEDSQSIIVAYGNKQNIEISCADTGNGIISTLGKTLSTKDYRPEGILLESLKKGVTSKELTNHMGYGLWILDQITSATKGRMQLYTQGVYYINENGLKKTGQCGYWQGTIISISLPLEKPKTLEDIETEFDDNTIKINWA